MIKRVRGGGEKFQQFEIPFALRKDPKNPYLFRYMNHHDETFSTSEINIAVQRAWTTALNSRDMVLNPQNLLVSSQIYYCQMYIQPFLPPRNDLREGKRIIDTSFLRQYPPRRQYYCSEIIAFTAS